MTKFYMVNVPLSEDLEKDGNIANSPLNEMLICSRVQQLVSASWDERHHISLLKLGLWLCLACMNVTCINMVQKCKYKNVYSFDENELKHLHFKTMHIFEDLCFSFTLKKPCFLLPCTYLTPINFPFFLHSKYI
jgi:hypothetical protein